MLLSLLGRLVVWKLDGLGAIALVDYLGQGHEVAADREHDFHEFRFGIDYRVFLGEDVKWHAGESPSSQFYLFCVGDEVHSHVFSWDVSDGLVSVNFRNSHDDLLIKEVEKLKLVVDQLGQLIFFSCGYLGDKYLLSFHLILSFLRGWNAHLLIFSFLKHYQAIFDDWVAQEFYDND